ncbi:hypothetical protein CES85_1163 [Ochrobactrum quorumnocens]|uniref:Uncharacterized protein n=1 Tax=Ochrobactrum quorumnocens TaxID=271865 RepID=A0A248UH17_9HYPH|nr:hypothetical protein CES85_1163 [[Ochrobactrum] quorumnocens]
MLPENSLRHNTSREACLTFQPFGQLIQTCMSLRISFHYLVCYHDWKY